MKILDQIVPQTFIQATGYTILHSLWQGLFVGVLLAVLLMILHRQTAVLRYRLALSALLVQVLLSAGTFWFYYNSATATGQILANANIKSTVLLQPIANQNTLQLSWASISIFFQAQLPVIVTVWLMGILFMLLRFLGGLVYLQRLRVYKNNPLSAHWQNKIDNLTARLQLNVAVVGAESGLVKTPLVIGFLKPLILLPLGTLANLPVNQVEAILAHEVAHIRRHDYFINLLQSLVEVLFFYHPAIWWVSDFVRIERENCCDDLAIAICPDKFAYAQALTALEELKLQAPALSLAFAGKDGSVLGRIKRLFQQPSVKPSFREGLLAVAILLISLTLISAAAVANYKAKTSVSQAAVVGKDFAPAMKASETEVSFNDKNDSTKKKGEVIIFQDKSGKIIELYIDGKKVPEEQLSNYQTFKLERPLGTVVNENYKKSDNYKRDDVIVLKGSNIIGINKLNRGVSKNIPPVPPHPKNPGQPGNPPIPPAPVDAPPAKTIKPGSNIQHRSQASNPLYILDGKKIDKVVMDKINPNSISRIDVLKDGAATSIYGEAGKNGVVLITTKSGSARTLRSESDIKPVGTLDQKAPEKATTITKAHSDELNDTANPNYKAKTEAILKELKKDNLYSDDKLYTLKITNSGMYINNVKQSDALFQKYRKYLPYPDMNISNQTFEINGRFTQK